MQLSTSRFAGCCAALVFASCASAADFGTSLNYSITDSTNLAGSSLRASVREIDPIPIVAGIRHDLSVKLEGQERSSLLDYDLDFSIAKAIYEDDVLDESLSGTGSAQVEYRIRPGTLKWVLADYHFISADDLVSLTQDDGRTNTNALVTGPQFTYRINAVDTAKADAFLLNYWRESVSNEQFFLGRAKVTRQMNSRRSLGLHYNLTQLFNSENDNTYSLNNIFARLNTRLPNQTSAEIDLGVSFNNYNSVADDDSTKSDLYFAARLSRQFSRTWRGQVTTGRGYTDSTQASLVSVLAGEQSAVTVSSNGVFLNDYARLSVTREGPVWSMGAGLSWSKADYESVANDRETTSASVYLNYLVTGRLGFFAGASYQDDKLSPLAFDRVDSSEQATAGLSWQHTTGVRSTVGWETSSVDSAGADGLGLFEEEAVRYTLSWVPKTRLDLLKRTKGRRELKPLI